jgi:epoxyqueuosine reductase
MGRHGFLARLEVTASLRLDPRNWLPWARSVLSVAIPYNTRRDSSAHWVERGRLWVSRYAWGRDYHKTVRLRLGHIASRLESRGVRARACADSAPVMERTYALAAGLGFAGRNGLLIHPELGSYLFLGAVVTDMEPPPAAPGPIPSGCGDCRLCVTACPTGALCGSGDLDAGRCISAWTVEWPGPFPDGRPALHGNLFGCDLCQEACPYNRDAPLSPEEDFRPREPWFAPDLAEVLSLTEAEWVRAAEGMVLRRAGYGGIRRTARAAAGDGGGGAPSGLP